MSRNQDVKYFLTRRREAVSPAEYGFATTGRRVKGLRREEVAQLAAVSVSWYTWLEQGRSISISHGALQRIARVLKLSPVEQDYLEDIVLGHRHSPARTSRQLPEEVIAMVDALNPHPAFVRSANMDILYWNEAAKNEIFDWSAVEANDRNSLKLMFINSDYRKIIHDWDTAAKHTISAFRSNYAAGKQTEEFEAVISTLDQQSADFRRMWNYHDVSKIGTGNKAIIGKDGNISRYTYTSLEVENLPGVFVLFYLKTPGS
ncbi:helix-turn-helix transcriptional regulator [Winslowiella iniecta]|uniref:DNA-binding protein n=1 Tax=Winslowiella iniecta TaxID=1560201 RepID=A0A0L7T984_9GAMM|nr:helix-turn-helix transcriptional regulator [Winslowiella iniecta]KOC91937.1 DNA-binding protein [Winslowiella iniecta]KOC94941.1 DNA-binding protein [Winslowiella iniecta]